MGHASFESPFALGIVHYSPSRYLFCIYVCPFYRSDASMGIEKYITTYDTNIGISFFTLLTNAND